MRFREMKRKVETGEIVSLNRGKADIKEKKIAKGGLTAGTWYLRNSTYKVISCQPTPGGVLASKIKAALNPAGTKERIQVTED